MLKNGIVSTVNRKTGAVDVLFQSEDNKVVTMPLLECAQRPNVRDQVACIMDSSGFNLCLGRFYSEINRPDWKE